MAIVLTVAMQLPVLAKISHAVYDHVDTECSDYGSLHIHEVEFDCEFQKYNLSTNCVVPDIHTDALEPLSFQESNFSDYFFLSKYQKLHFSLRAPPAFS